MATRSCAPTAGKRVRSIQPHAAASLACVLVGCGPYRVSTENARASFVAQASCPPNQVTVKERPDLDHATLLFRSLSRPPADIAADRVRLEVWKDTQRKSSAVSWSNSQVFELDGCGVHSLLACKFWHGLVQCSDVVPLEEGSDPVAGTPQIEYPRSSVSRAGATPEMLEATAAQLDASGQTGIAQMLRAVAEQLRKERHDPGSSGSDPK